MPPPAAQLADDEQIEHLAKQAMAQFEQQFGRSAEVLALAPGRVNLIGDHVDYEGGVVMPMAINRFVLLAAGTRREQQGQPLLRGISMQDGNLRSIQTLANLLPAAASSETVAKEQGWMRFVAGMLAGYVEQGWSGANLDFSLVSSLPIGAGLSSSAALELATANALESLRAPALTPTERALLGQRVEHEYLGVPCGIMDQLAVVQGQERHALLMDCQALSVEPIPLPEEAAFLVIDSGVEHELAQSEYPKRRQQCAQAAQILGHTQLAQASLAEITEGLADEPLLRNRATHVVEEIARVRAFAQCLSQGELDKAEQLQKAGELMNQSHASLRDLYEVSCAEVDALVELAQKTPGVLGARMTGGGFGGSVVCLVEKPNADFVLDKICEIHSQSTSRKRAAFVAEAVQGARPLPLLP